jgi:hypothetical protein
MEDTLYRTKLTVRLIGGALYMDPNYFVGFNAQVSSLPTGARS